MILMPTTHDELDRRSLVLHARIVERLRDDPSLLEVAKANLNRWRHRLDQDDLAAPTHREWRHLLETLEIEELSQLLLRDDETSARLRQSSPFAGILSPPEVWEIKKQFANEEARA